MKAMLFFALLSACVFITTAKADHHGQNAPGEMVTLNLCTLNEGHTYADVVSFQNRWTKWAKSRGINLFNELLSPLITSMPPSESSLDFIELSVTDYEHGGQMLADWAGTDEGQSFAQEWGEVASCSVRLQHLVMKYQDMAALAEDRDRIVTFTRCEIHEGVTGDDLRAVHQRALDQRDESATNLYWGVMLPRTGGTDGRNVFRHANIFADIEAYTANLAGMPRRQPRITDYNQRYASCDLPTVWSSEVMSMIEN